MGHNWVLVMRPTLLRRHCGPGAGAGELNYVRRGDTHVLAHTKTIGGGETTSVTFPTSILRKAALPVPVHLPGHSALIPAELEVPCSDALWPGKCTGTGRRRLS